MSLLDRLLARLVRGAGARGIPALDLHGLGVRDAIAATERFLADCAAAGVAEVRLVYGKGRGSPGGRGVLREVIPRWLAAEGARYVASATPEPDATGADGAMRVRVRPVARVQR
ncbi:MAG: Smr/MutS family protein [Deltaproteobacteria bacterium]|nr:Smr/MutS family protein [Deltaproteobacteria bacterium]